MLEILDRLGRAVYRLCVGVAVILLALGLLYALAHEQPSVSLFWLLPIVPILGVGYTFRYVLSRPSSRSQRRRLQKFRR